MARRKLDEAVAAARRELPRSCPLHVRANGQYGRRHAGRVISFGSVLQINLAEALRRYHAWSASIQAGETPDAVDANDVTVERVFEAFAARQLRRVERGTLQSSSYRRYERLLPWAAERLGIDTPVRELGRRHFSRLIDDAEETGWAPSTTSLMVSIVRACFNWAVDDELIDATPAFGRRFVGQGKGAQRRHRASRGRGGSLAFTAPEVRGLLEVANPHMRVAVLLGISCGYGQADVAALPRTSLDFDRGWIVFPRPKTGVERQAPMWPELAGAWRAWDEGYAGPDSEDRRRLAIVNRNGLPFVREIRKGVVDGRLRTKKYDGIRAEFNRMLVKAGIRNPVAEGRDALDAKGLSFYSLRRTFATVAMETRDAIAVKRAMGHAIDSDITGGYVDRVAEQNLRAVSQHVRSWLFPAAQGDGDADPGASEPGSAPRLRLVRPEMPEDRMA